MSNAALQAVEVLPASEPKSSNPITPMDMLDKAISTGANIEVLEKLMALNERWERSQARKAFDEAMAAAKADIPVILKNRTVDFPSKGEAGRTNYRHEDLGEIARTVDPVLSRHGLSYRFRTTSEPNEPVTVTCIVSHRLGHFEENTLRAGRDDSGKKNSLQSIGSTLTYLQRYSLKAALGLAAAADDDAASSPASDETISDDQLAELQSLADSVGADIPKFCKYLKIGSLADIKAPDFANAKAALEAKRART